MPVQDKLPTNFVLTDIPKFKGTEDPLQHIRSYKEYLALRGVPAEMLPHIFAQSLGEHPKAWFYSLELKNFPTFEDIAVEFCKHFAIMPRFGLIVRTLEVMTRRIRRDFFNSSTIWPGRESVKLAKRPEETEMVDKFIKNLRPVYRDAIKYQHFGSFKDLIRVGRKIEDDVRSAEVEKPKGYQGASFSKAKASSSANHIQAIGLLGGAPKGSQRHGPRAFTDIGCTYAYALQRLSAQGKLNPIGPTPDPLRIDRVNGISPTPTVLIIKEKVMIPKIVTVLNMKFKT
ncbi:uncharacterized protein LOC141616989 [Silene latifolia]|uniref:uncharacterized protein LOC141616989 n=1 Tax=Silene latifolia TaxID=37657 RepID=UPI003D783310